MKVAVQCNSPLLQKSLELFLKNHLTSIKQCDIVLRDHKVIDAKHSLYISSDKDAELMKPFSKSQLLLKLEQQLKSHQTHTIEKPHTTNVASNDFHKLEQKIEAITRSYQNELMTTIKEYYEKNK